MKKIIAIVTLTLAFSLGANAQDKKVISKAETTTEVASPEVAAKNDAEALVKFLNLPENEFEMYKNLFFVKHNTLKKTELSNERKAELKRNIDAKLRATLSAENMEKLDKNAALLKKLTE
jgi:hypothetical protein